VSTASGSELPRIEVDVADWGSVLEGVRVARDALGPIERVIHTAAIMPTSLAVDDDVQRIARVMRINYQGTVHVIHAVLPAMLARGSGEIILFSSVAAEALTPHMSAYAASKAAVSAYVETLQHELAGTGVTVRLVLPPMTDTPLVDQARTTSNPRSFQLGFERDIVAKPEAIIDGAERGIAQGKTWIYPHRMAVALHLARRFTPRLLWWTIERAEREGR
jgi:short-subunit dehydrogenase